MGNEKFEVICRTKDVNSSNVAEIFESYGCSTLEAKVPVVNDRVAERVKNSNFEQQHYDTLVLKSESATNALMGRVTRTRNRPLALVEIGQEVVIAAGKEREKSPVDKEELDDDLDEYMKKTAEIKAKRAQAKRENELVRERAMAQSDIIMQNDDPDWD